MLRRFLFLGIFSATVFSLCLPYAQARRDEVQDANRLALLQQATGNAAPTQNSSSSFQARVNAIMDTSSSVERTAIVYNEAQDRKIIAKQQDEFELEEEFEPASKTNNSLKKQDQKKVSNTLTKTKLDGTERGFQAEREKIQSEFDERIKKPVKPAEGASPAPSSDLLKETGTLAPSLANNPFYVSPDGSGRDQARFAERKSIITSRVASSLNIPSQEAEDLVSGTSNPEELVLRLMQDYEVTYGEASDMTS